MSDNIPFEIQIEIIKKVVTVKSLIRFRTVSKQWKSLIDSSKFIIDHSYDQTHPNHLLVRYRNTRHQLKYVSIVDDDSFPRNKFYHSHTIPDFLKRMLLSHLVGCSHGLVCLYGSLRNENKIIGVWNPSIRKSISVVVNSDRLVAVGFGVCPKTDDLKIIKITAALKAKSFTGPLKAELFTLSTGAWKSIPVNTSPRSFESFPKQVVIDGVVHWNPGAPTRHIVMFDLVSEEFGQLDLPDSLSKHVQLFIYKPKETFALFSADYFFGDGRTCDVWMIMKENGDSMPSFNKLYTFACGNLEYYTLQGYRMNGQLIMMEGYDDEDDEDDNDELKYRLKVYDPSSKHMNDLEIDADATYYDSFEMTSYTESLFMLNQPATIFE